MRRPGSALARARNPLGGYEPRLRSGFCWRGLWVWSRDQPSLQDGTNGIAFLAMGDLARLNGWDFFIAP